MGLATQLYDEPELRQSRDIDILIPLSASKTAIQLLTDNGYLHVPLTQRTKKSDKLKHKLSDMRLFKDITYRDPKFSVVIELHQRLFKVEPKAYTLDFNHAVNFQTAPSIIEPQYCLYIILHGAVSYWKRLKWIVDLSLLANKITVQNRVTLMELSKAYGCKTAVIASLQFVEEIFEGSLDKDWKIILNEKHGTKDIQALNNIFWTALLGNSQSQYGMPKKNEIFNDPASTIFPNQISPVTIAWSKIRTSLAARLY